MLGSLTKRSKLGSLRNSSEVPSIKCSVYKAYLHVALARKCSEVLPCPLHQKKLNDFNAWKSEVSEAPTGRAGALPSAASCRRRRSR